MPPLSVNLLKGAVKMGTIKTIIKRDGRKVDFDIDKITNAIFKAKIGRAHV